MSKGIRLLLAVSVAAVIVVVVRYQLAASTGAGWDELFAATSSGATVESLEAARVKAESTEAMPWLDYQLAVMLFDKGDAGSLERARQLAEQSVARNPSHATTPWMRKLLQAVDSFPPATAGA